MARYGSTSPWQNTPYNRQGALDLMRIRAVPSSPDDLLYTIETQYAFRPDLLAYDYYKTPKLWWVFAQRNMDIIKDPIFDFTPGTSIYLPKPENIKKVLKI